MRTQVRKQNLWENFIPRTFDLLTEEQGRPKPPLTSFLSQIPDLAGVPTLPNVADYLPIVLDHVREGRFQDAQTQLYAAIRHSYFVDNRMAVQRYLQLLAQLERARGSLRRELEALLAMVDIMETRTHENQVSEAMLQITVVSTLLGEEKAAQVALERFHGFRRWENHIEALGDAYDLLGLTYVAKGDFVRALDWYQRALDVKTRAPITNPNFRDPDGIRKPHSAGQERIDATHLYLADLALRSGDTAQARAHLKQCRGERPTPHLLSLYLRLGDKKELQGLLVRVREQQTKDPTRLDLETKLGYHRMLALLHLELSAPEKALEELEQARASAKELESRNQASVKNDREAMEARLSQGDRYYYLWVAYFAIDTRDPAIPLHRIYALMARAHRQRKAWKDAIAAQREAIAAWPGFVFSPNAFVEGSDSRREQEPGLLVELARLLRESGQKDEAKATLRQATLGVAKMVSQPERVKVLEELAHEWERLGMPGERRQALEAAVGLYESLVTQVSDPTQSLLFPALSPAPLYQGLAALALEENKPALEALALLERGRGQALAALLAQGQLDPAELLPPAEATELKTLRRSLQEASADLRWVSVNDQLGNYQRFKQRYEELATRYTKQEAVLRSRYPLLATATQPPRPTPASLLALAKARPDTLFILYSLGQTKATIYTLCAETGARAISLSTTNLETLCGAWRRALRQSTILGMQEEARLSKVLGERLWKPIEQAGIPKCIRHLVFVPEGALHALPFAALQIAPGQRLMERYPSSCVLSLGTLLLPTPARPKPTRELLCLADPTDIPLPKNAPAVATLRRRLGPLRYAREEARAVAAHFPTTLSLIGPNATEERVRTGLTTSRILHFATHGIVDSQNGLRSWLLLANRSEGSDEDGRLEASEIARTPLCASLAVLSACESSLGQASASEGLLGFAWAFHVAGCPSVIGTLWAIDDRATAIFMTQLYTRLRAGDAKDTALQSAMQTLLKDPQTRAPFYWAPFLLTGDSKSLTS